MPVLISKPFLCFICCAELKIASETARSGAVQVRIWMPMINTAFRFRVTSLLQVQSDIAVMMRENEAQQQLLKELQARHILHEFEQNFPLFHVSMHHLFYHV